LVAAAVCIGAQARASTLITLASIAGSGDGNGPVAPMINVGGTLYSTAPNSGPANCGVVFQFDPVTKAEKVVYGFKGGADGCAPVGALVSVGKMLYGTTSHGGARNAGTIFQIDLSTGAETELYAFSGSDGAGPQGSLVALNGLLYGTASQGGFAGAGTVFSFNPKTQTLVPVYEFTGQGDGGNPAGGLLYSNGFLFGTVPYGGPGNAGAVFRIDPATGAQLTVYGFTGGNDGSEPTAALLDVNGMLYGTTQLGGTQKSGTLFAVDPGTGTEKVIYNFGQNAGAGPSTGLTFYKNHLYGTTLYGGEYYFGVLYSIDLNTGTHKVLHAFGQGLDGSNPTTPIEVDGTLYGVAETRGAGGAGAIYAVPLATGVESVAYSFTGANALESNEGLNVSQGKVFAAIAQGGSASAGEVVSISPLTGSVSQVASFDGAAVRYPSAGLVQAGSYLYGTSKEGGPTGSGTVYRLDPATGATSVVYNFTGGKDGFSPYSALVNDGPDLVGTTYGGGLYGNGTVFSVSPQTGVEKVLHSFAGQVDGAILLPGMLNIGGTLYGVTAEGGAYGYGSLFSMAPGTHALTILHDFTGGNDGGIPSSSVIDVNGTLYGVTLIGGAQGNGVVYSYNLASKTQTTVHAFTGGADGDVPIAPLLKVGNFLYGTTSGEFGGSGTIYKIDIATGAEKVVYNFTGGWDGGLPNSNLVDVDGRIFGATGSGGASGIGTIFSLQP